MNIVSSFHLMVNALIGQSTKKSKTQTLKNKHPPFFYFLFIPKKKSHGQKKQKKKMVEVQIRKRKSLKRPRGNYFDLVSRWIFPIQELSGQ